MRLQTETAQNILQSLSKQLERKQNMLRFVFLTQDGNASKEGLIRYVSGHPEGDSLSKIIQESKKIKNSCCLGIVGTNVPTLMGMAKKKAHLALININLKEISSKSDLIFEVYRCIGEATTLVRKHTNSQNIVVSSILDTRQRVIHNILHDIFAGLMMIGSGDKDAFRHIAEKRAAMSLVPRAGYLPEDYPFAVAHELLIKTYEENPVHERTPYKFDAILDTAREYTKLVDGKTIQKWRNFVTPAQNMLWRGYSKEQALASAVRFSEDANATQIGMLVSDLLEIEALESDDIPEFFNGFASDERNSRQHQKHAEEIFETAISISHREQSAEHLFQKANELNMKLTGGRIMGWCSSALQAAGNAFEKALRDKVHKEDASNVARASFEKTQQETSWESLRKFGERVIRKNRIGANTSLQDLKDMAEENSEFKHFADSISATLSDPIYLKALEAVNDSAPVANGPKISRNFGLKMPGKDLGYEGSRPTHAPPVEMSLGLGSKDSGAKSLKGNRTVSVIDNKKTNDEGDTAHN